MLSISAIAQTKLSDFQWKNRILVFSASNSEFTQKVDLLKEEIKERDLIVIFLDGKIAPSLKSDIEERFSLKANKPAAILIGKDGSTTLRWNLSDFTFKKLFLSIDSMPMRQAEMQLKKKGD